MITLGWDIALSVEKPYSIIQIALVGAGHVISYM